MEDQLRGNNEELYVANSDNSGCICYMVMAAHVFKQRLKVSSVDCISKSCLLPEFCCKSRNPRSSWFTHFKFRVRKDSERSTTSFFLSVCPQQTIPIEFFFQLLLSIQMTEEKPFCALSSPNTNFSQKITNREDNEND